jgi:tRNA dimethylallyltransferase
MIFILGPTASGKSAIALELAERFPIEIVSVDSALVYRGMDIGTAKPSPAERDQVAHHLIDIIEPSQSYSAARFASDAARLIGEIEGRGRLPLLVGGTMLYAKALIEGLHDLPAADPQVRAAIDRDALELGWPALHERLAGLDPVTAGRLAPRDAQRIQRALEVVMTTGRPLSAWLAEAARQSADPAVAGRPVTVIALEPSDRSVLHRRIEQRFEAMIHAGLIDEVRGLRSRGDLAADCPALRSVGYRQVWAWLESGESTPLKQLIETGVAATRQLAKRQLTWLRSMPRRQVIDCLASDRMEQVEQAVRTARAIDTGAGGGH